MTQRELNTILAALRFWQWQRGDYRERMDDILNIEHNSCTAEPLSDQEIDELCERINVSGGDDCDSANSA